MHSTISALPTGSTYSAERLRRQDTEREGMLQLGGVDIVSKAKAKKGKKKALCYRKEARIDRSRIEREHCVALQGCE